MVVFDLLSDKPGSERRYYFLRFLLVLIVTVAGIITVYHTTIYGLKSELAGKADSQIVEEINRRLIRIETILTERMATKRELLQVRDSLSSKLISIETQLSMIQ